MALPGPQHPATLPADVLRVLVVEDNAADSMIAGAAVARAASGPYVVLAAESVASALGLIASNDVHLVLLDLNLPDSKGLDTLRRVRAATRSPIIVVTVEDAPGMDDSALEAGAFEVLHKGRVSADAIARLLRMAHARRRLQRGG
jgi:DNA-binding response OmpR family regulator